MKGAMMIPNIEKTPHCIALGIEYETEQAKVVILIQFIDFFCCVCTQTFITANAFGISRMLCMRGFSMAKPCS